MRRNGKNNLLGKARQGGSMVVAATFGIIAMLGTAGLAVDIGRAQLAQSKLSSALDAAGLAAGASISTQDLNTEVNKYLNVNFNNYLDATIDDIDPQYDPDTNVITVTATGHIETTFMKYFGIDTVPIDASTEITRATSGLELALVLDNTGSMAGTRLSALKDAASEMVGTLFGDGTNDQQHLWIGVVPFSQAVNIGTQHESWLTTGSIAAKNWGPDSWAGCVDARLSSLDTTDSPPSSGSFEPYYWPDDGNNNWIKTTTKKGKTTTTYTIDDTHGPNKYCPQSSMGLTSDESAVLTAIDNMEARGNTHIVTGAVWGWRMLSPNWRGLWGGEMDENDLPLDYNTPRMNKAVVIMTDGENTISSSSHGAYWYLSDGRLGTTDQNTAVDELDTRLSSVCTQMKNNNVIVYTIAFGSPGTSIQNLLRNCVSQADYYFDSPDSDELHKAFRQIGDSLSNLRVSK